LRDIPRHDRNSLAATSGFEFQTLHQRRSGIGFWVQNLRHVCDERKERKRALDAQVYV
jgi:hypothetical protein